MSRRLETSFGFTESSFQGLRNLKVDHPEYWPKLTAEFGIKREKRFCLGGKLKPKCWTLDKVVVMSPSVIQITGGSVRPKQKPVILRLYTSKDDVSYKHHVLLDGLSYIVKLTASGSYTAGKQRLYALATTPTHTVQRELLAIVQGKSRDSMLFKRSQIRKIIVDVLHGLQQMWSKHVYYATFGPWVVALESPATAADPSPQLVTAKLGNFPSTKVANNPNDAPSDIRFFGHSFLMDIAGVLYHEAQNRTNSEEPCSATRDGSNVWLKEVCEIVVNLDRITQGVQNMDGEPWSRERVLQDAWVKGGK